MSAAVAIEPAPAVAPARKPRLSTRALRFARAYADPASTTYHNATRSAIEAGYSRKSASQASYRLMHSPDVKQAIAECLEITKHRPDLQAAVTRERMTLEHLRVAAMCEARGDMSTCTRNLEAVDDLHGLRTPTQQVDISIRVAYDSRLAVEAARLAAIALEDAGAAGLGAGPVIDVESRLLPAGHSDAQDMPDLEAMQGEPGPAAVPEQAQEERQDGPGATIEAAPDSGHLAAQDAEPEAAPEPPTCRACGSLDVGNPKRPRTYCQECFGLIQSERVKAARKCDTPFTPRAGGLERMGIPSGA